MVLLKVAEQVGARAAVCAVMCVRCVSVLTAFLREPPHVDPSGSHARLERGLSSSLRGGDAIHPKGCA